MNYNPLDNGIKQNWAVTVQIPAFKKLNIGDKYLPYSKFSQDTQSKFVKDSILTAFNMCFEGIHFLHDITEDEIYLEHHQDGRIHAHFSYIGCYDEIYEVQKYFCKDIIKIRPKQFQAVFNFFIPDNFYMWVQYTKKDQKRQGDKLEDLEADLAELNK